MVLTEAAGDAELVLWDGAKFGHRPELSVRKTRLHILLFNAIFGAFSKSSLQSLSIADIFSVIDLTKPHYPLLLSQHQMLRTDTFSF